MGTEQKIQPPRVFPELEGNLELECSTLACRQMLQWDIHHGSLFRSDPACSTDQRRGIVTRIQNRPSGVSAAAEEGHYLSCFTMRFSKNLKEVTFRALLGTSPSSEKEFDTG